MCTASQLLPKKQSLVYTVANIFFLWNFEFNVPHKFGSVLSVEKAQNSGLGNVSNRNLQVGLVDRFQIV